MGQRLTVGVKWMLGIQAAVWLLAQPLGREFARWVIMEPRAVMDGELWRLLSYPLWMNLWDLVFFAIVFFWAGSAVEEQLGTRRFVRFLAGSVLTGSLFILAAGQFFSTGALAGCATLDMAVVAAFARIHPNMSVRLMFVMPVRAVHLVWFAVGMRVLTMWEAQQFLWPVAAELVTAALGYWGLPLWRGGWGLADLNPVEWVRNWQYRRKVMKFKVHSGGKKSDPNQYLH